MEVVGADSSVLAGRMERYLRLPPTAGQQKMFASLADFICADPADKWLMTVKGYAGTGKTSALAAFIRVLKSLKYNYVLLAPTGRAAKVLSNFTKERVYTIHKKIYRQQSLSKGFAKFSLDYNKSKDTVYIVDEVSLISIGGEAESMFGSGDVLEDLIAYIRSNASNRLILTGDPAQLPPVGMEESPALDIDYLGTYSTNIMSVELTDVVRQAAQSGILVNATRLREQIGARSSDMPAFTVKGFSDIHSITGEGLIEAISDAISKYGEDEVVVLCRSNMRANRYNRGIRAQVLYREERLSKGDKLMIVKNCYNFEGQSKELDFIANGDVAELARISDYQERYGLHFADATLVFPDYNYAEADVKLILDTLDSTSAALGREQQTALFEAVYQDYDNIASKKDRYKAVREDPYFNALQVKYSAAITGHKSQGGQWKCVFIDNILWKDEVTLEDRKWLYTALTRGVKEVYLVNFNKKYLD